MTRIAHLLTCVTLGMILCGGCTSLTKRDDGAEKKGFFDRMPWAKDKTPKPYATPAKMAATWTAETLTQTGRVTTRGFGARIFFYDDKSRAVPVDGTLVVHGFDETATDPSTATKRYEFTPEQLTQHYGSSELGASYSVWIPWDAVGGPQARISLVATFRTDEGHTIQGTPTMVLLPGTKDNSAEALAKRYSPEFRQWQQASSGQLAPKSGLTTTTIQRPASRSMIPAPESNPQPATSTWNLAKQNGPPAGDVVMRNTGAIAPTEAPATAPTTAPTIRTLPASTRLPKSF